MKKILSIVLSIVFCLCLSSCENDNSNVGTQKPIEKPQINIPSLPPLPSFDYDFEIETPTKQERTVYVSKSGGKIHSIPYCSGMKYYYEMSYSDAVNKGYDFCENCN